MAKRRETEAQTGSETRRISAAVLANVAKYREDLAEKIGMAPEERQVIETAILEGLDALRAKAKLARR